MLVDLLVDRGQQRRAERGERVADAVFHRDQRALQLGLVALNRDQHFSRFRLRGLRDGVRLLEPGHFFLQALDLLFELAVRGVLSSLLVESIPGRLPQPVARVLPRFLNRRYRAFAQTKPDVFRWFRFGIDHGNSLNFI